MATERSPLPDGYARTEHHPRPVVNEFTGDVFDYDATAPRQADPDDDVDGRPVYLSDDELLAALERASHDDANV